MLKKQTILLIWIVCGPVYGQNSDHSSEAGNGSLSLEGPFKASYEGQSFKLIFSKNSNGIFGFSDVDFAKNCDNGGVFYRNGVLQGRRLSIDAISCSSSEQWGVNGWIIDSNTARIEMMINDSKVPVLFERIR